MEALNLVFVGTVSLWTVQCAALALDKGQSLAIRIVCVLQSWRSFVAGQETHSLNQRFLENYRLP
jgi:hypothetical protein